MTGHQPSRQDMGASAEAMVERVARAMHPRTWKHFLRHAELALEASHHAELVEAAEALLRDANTRADLFNARCRDLRAVLAKIGGDA